MDIRKYREELEREIGPPAAEALPADITAVESAAAERRLRRAGVRRPATPLRGDFLTFEAGPSLDRLGPVLDEGTLLMRGLITRLADPEGTPESRLAALAELKASRFFGSLLAPSSADFTAALRAAVRSDDPALRASALEVLVARKDEVGRELLLEGLRDPAKAVVPVAKAIRLLARDDHGEAVPLVRSLLDQGLEQDATEEALRLLASDPGSADLFERLLGDRSQTLGVRTASAVGLHVVAPDRYAEVATAIVADATEDDDIRATCLSALGHARSYSPTRADAGFSREVAALAEGSDTPSLRATARQYLSRSGRE